MKYIYISVFLISNISLFGLELKVPEYRADKIPQNMSVATKKKRFYALLVPPIQKVHAELTAEYLRVKDNIINKKEMQEIDRLKLSYKVKSDEELLYALKPHPQSVALAQAAMESAWATSRFFREANNVFGMWSSNKNEPRIAAGEKRGGKKTIWLRKFDSVEDSIRAYYRLMAKGRAYKEFRETRYKTGDVHEIVKKLDKYSEIGELYGKELSQVIKYNKLVKYDR